MEFIENNYVWVIVIGVVLLMTIIGYFADKMETKEEKPKKKKEKKNQVLDSVPEVEEQKNDGELPPEWDETKKVVDEEQEIMNIEGTANTNEWNELPEVNFAEENNEMNFDNNDWSMDNNESVGEEIVEGNQELSFEQPDFSFENVEVPTEQIDDMNEQVAAEVVEQPVEVQTSEEEVAEEPIPEQIDELNNLEITLPDIESLNVEENENDEDVWKF